MQYVLGQVHPATRGRMPPIDRPLSYDSIDVSIRCVEQGSAQERQEENTEDPTAALGPF